MSTKDDDRAHHKRMNEDREYRLSHGVASMGRVTFDKKTGKLVQLTPPDLPPGDPRAQRAFEPLIKALAQSAADNLFREMHGKGSEEPGKPRRRQSRGKHDEPA